MPKNSTISQSVQDTYNKISQQFSASRNYIWPDLKPYLDQVKPQSTVLDLGCGNGRLLLGLPKPVTYIGIDFSKPLIEHAQKLYPHNHFIQADITKPETWSALPKFDYIFSVAVIHHLPTTKEQLFVLQQIQKHLQPNGKCLITAWDLWQPKFFKYHLDLKTKFKNWHYLYIPFQGHNRFHFAYTTHYLKALLCKSQLNLLINRSQRNFLLHNFPNP